MPSMAGHWLRLPLTSTLPVFTVSWQVKCTETEVVACATTLKDAEPLHCEMPSLVVAVSVMEAPLPAGTGLIVAEIVVLVLTSIEPVLLNVPGPVMVYETELMLTPGWSCNARPTSPVRSLSECAASPPACEPLSEQASAASGTNKAIAVRTLAVRPSFT
jgi:hypothetical protein